MTILNREHLRTFHRKLYAGFNETVILRKRGDDQLASQSVTVHLYECRWSRIFRTKEPIEVDMTASSSRTLHIPLSELNRAGLDHINAADEFTDKDGRVWNPESTVTITEKLMESHIDVPCLRIR